MSLVFLSFCIPRVLVISKRLLCMALLVAMAACGQTQQRGSSPQRPTTEKQDKPKAKDKSGSDAKKDTVDLPSTKSTESGAETKVVTGVATTSPQTSTPPATATVASISTSQNPSLGSPASGPSPSSDPNVVVFRIKAGTGRGPWNDAANPIRIRVGQTLEVHNDDTIQHWIHTDFGQFMTHPFSGINPGQSTRYQVANANARGLHDHNTGGAIYMEITP